MEARPLPPFIIVDGYRFTRVEGFKTRNLNWLCAASTRCTATVRTDKTGSKVLRKIGVHRRCRRVPEEEQQQAVEDEARRFLPGIEYRPIIAEVKGFITCVLCSGYLIDATTITGCLHTFCRSCIIKHLEEKRFCPKCNTYLPHENGDYTDKAILSDTTVQTLVYKLVPGLYKSETDRRLKAIKDLKTHVDPVSLPLVSPDDTIHISIEYNRSTADGVDVAKSEANEAVLGKRYLKCPSGVTIRILKRFIRMKYGIQEEWRVEIFYNGESMNDNFSLADMVYTFGSEENVPIAFSYQVYLEKTVPLHSSNKHHVIQKENTRTETSPFGGKNEVASSMQQFSKSTSKSVELSALLVGTPKVRLVTKRHGKRRKRHNAGVNKRLKLLVGKATATGPSNDDHSTTVLSVFSTQATNGTSVKTAALEGVNVADFTSTERTLRCRSKKPSKELDKSCESNSVQTERPRRCKRKYEASQPIPAAQNNNKGLETVATNTSRDSETKTSKERPSGAGSAKVRNNRKRKSRGKTCVKPYNTFVYTGRKLVTKHWLSGTIMKLRYRRLVTKAKKHRSLAKRTKKGRRIKTLTEKTRRRRKTRLGRKAMSKNTHLSADEAKNITGNQISFDNESPEDVKATESHADCSKVQMGLEPTISASENSKKSTDDTSQTAGRQYSEKCNNLKRIIDVVKSNTSPKAIPGRRQNELDSSDPAITETVSKSSLSENIALFKPGLEININNRYNYFNSKLNSPNVDMKEAGANGGQDGAQDMAFDFSEEEEDDEVELVLRISESEDEQNQTEINTDYDFFNLRPCQPNKKAKLDSEEADNCKKSKVIDESLQIKKENRNKNEEKCSLNNPCVSSEEVSENGGLKSSMINSKSNHRNSLLVPGAAAIKLPMKESNKLTASNILANSNRNGSSQNQKINVMKKPTFEKDSHQIKVQNNLCAFGGFNGSNSTITPKYKNISTTESKASEERPVKCEVKPDVPKELSCKVSGMDVMKSAEGKLSTKIPKELLLPFTLSVAKNDVKPAAADNVDVTLKPSLEILRLNPVEPEPSSAKGYASPSDYPKLIPKKPGRDLRKPPPPIPIVRISKIDELLSEISRTKNSEIKVHVDNDVADKRNKSEVLDLSKKSTRSRPTLIFPNHVNMIKNPHVSSEHKFSYPRSASTLSSPKTSPTLSDGGGYSSLHGNDTDISPVRNSNISKALDNARSSALINTLSSAAVSKDYHLHSAIAVLNRERMCGASVNVRPCDFPPSPRMVPNKINDKAFKSCGVPEKNPKLERSKSTGSLHVNHPQTCADSFPKFYPDPRSPILSPTQTAFRESPILARHITGRLAKAEQSKESNCFKGGFQRNGKAKVDGSEYFGGDTSVAKPPLVLSLGRVAPPVKKLVHNPYPGSAAPKANRKYQNTFVPPTSGDSYDNMQESPRSVPNKKLKFHDKSPPAETFPQTKLSYVGFPAISPSKRSEVVKSQAVASIPPARRLPAVETSGPRQEAEAKKLSYNHMKSMMSKQQNQTIRHIPNPSALTFRLQRSNSNVNPEAASEESSHKKKENVEAEAADQDGRSVVAPTYDGNARGGNDVYGVAKSSVVVTHPRPETPTTVTYASSSEGFQAVRNRANYGRSKTPTPEVSYAERNKYLYSRRSKTPTPDLPTSERNNNDANKNLNPFVLLPIISDVRSLAAGDFNSSEKQFRGKRRNSAVMEN